MGEPTTICFFLPVPRRTRLDARMGGGSELALFYLSRTLARMGFEVHVVIDEGSNMDYRLGDVWVHSHVIPNNPLGSYLSTLRRLTSLHRKHRFDLLVDFEQSLPWRKAFSGDAVVKFTRAGGVPLVYYFGNHIPWLIPKSEYDPWILWRTLRKVVLSSQRVIAASPTLALAAATRLGISEGEVGVVPFGLDLEDYRRRDGLLSTSRRRVVFVGRIVPHKGLEDLLEAAVLLRKEGFSFTVVGPRGWGWDDAPSEYYRSLVGRVRRAGLKDVVKFTGSIPRQEMISQLWGSNVFCFPTHREGFGVALIEAMAAGLTPVVWDIEPVNWVVGGGGVKAKPFDPESLAEGIVEADSNRHLKPLVEGRARDFAIERVAKMFLENVSGGG